MKKFNAKGFLNKCNGQITVPLPRKIMSKEIMNKIEKGEKLKLAFCD